jgi:hypothetical protein
LTIQRLPRRVASFFWSLRNRSPIAAL